MPNFKVSWEVDQEAETPAAAALLVARQYFQERIARGISGSACVFTVTEPNVPAYTVDLSVADEDLSASELQELYGYAGHPRFPWQRWRDLVADQATVLGYWDWVQGRVEAEKG